MRLDRHLEQRVEHERGNLTWNIRRAVTHVIVSDSRRKQRAASLMQVPVETIEKALEKRGDWDLEFAITLAAASGIHLSAGASGGLVCEWESCVDYARLQVWEGERQDKVFVGYSCNKHAGQFAAANEGDVYIEPA